MIEDSEKTLAMNSSTQILLLLGIVLILKVIFDLVVTRRQRNASARLLGCELAKSRSPSDLLGIETMISLFRALYGHRLPTWYIQNLNSVGDNIHTMSARIMLRDLIVTRDEKNLKTILSTQAGDWELGELRKGVFQSLAGNNIFSYEGSRWKHSRSLNRAAFSRGLVSDLAMYERHVQDLFQLFPNHHDGWTESFDVEPLMYRVTTDIITEFLYGHSVHGLNSEKQSALATKLGVADLPDAQTFINSLNAAADYLAFAGIFGNYHSYIPSWTFRRNVRSIRQYAQWFVKRRLQLLSNRNNAEKKPLDQRFVLLHELSDVMSDPVQLRDETIVLLAAGRSTTAVLMSWVIFFLAREPRVFDKLRSVIISTFGSEFDLQHDGFAELRQCKYLQFCINEALRLGTPTPLTHREASNDTILPSGGGADGASPIFVQKGTMVALSLFAMHHRADLWGDDVEEFRPERWEGKKIDWSFSPFGGGPRKCIGGTTLSQLAAVFPRLAYIEKFTKKQCYRTISSH